MADRLPPHQAGAVLILLMLVFSAVAAMIVATPAPAASAASSPLLHDDFTRDTSLNASLWVINGPVGSVLGPDDVGFRQAALAPAFSSTGMEIAQVNESQEVGTIESVESFAPPFTAVAVVEGTISNGHTFGFAIASAGASSGVLVYGNLNDTNCSHLGDCGDPAVCGTPASSSIPPNQCYYGIDAKVGRNSTSWPHVAKLYLTPSVNVFYTLQISVDASGSAYYSVSQGGQTLGQSTAQVGTGPFYVVMEQGEGSPVAKPGPNQAYWSSVSLGPLAVNTSTTFTLSSTTATSPAPSSPGIPTDVWIIIVIVLAVLFFIFILWYSRRGFTVRAMDSRTQAPIPEASVTAKGPEVLSGTTDKDGKVAFGKVDEGDYEVRVAAAGYNPPPPATVKVKGKTDYTAKLDRAPLVPPSRLDENLPSQGPGREAAGLAEGETTSHEGSIMAPSSVPETRQPPTGVGKTPQEGAAPAVTQPRPEPPPSGKGAPDELEGWGGGRIKQIIKTFQEKGAISPETALTAEELGLSRLFVRIMKRRKGKTTLFMEINGRYYLNQKALQETP